MSNVCSNTIEIIGDKDVITRMFELVKSEERDWGKCPSPHKTEEENKKWLGLEFDFNKVAPYPEKYAKWDKEYERREEMGVPYYKLPKSGYEKGGWKWCIDNWGTSHNATNASTSFIEPKKIKEVEGFQLLDYESPACGEIYYSTDWSPAYPVTEALAKQFPELSFKHYFEELGLRGTGYKVWKAGVLVAEHEDNLCDEEEEEDE